MSVTNPLNKAAIDEAAMKAVEDMDISMFSTGDVVNMILQRAQIIFDVDKGGQLIRAWSDGDPQPLVDVAEGRPELLIRRTLAAIYQEYQAMLPTLRAIDPDRIADIGCGYGFFDVFAARELGCDVVLIDIEENENRHFGYRMSGSAYSNLGVAAEFARANGVKKKALKTINPKNEDLTKVPPVDLAVSFMSCGFHYPVNTYMDYFRDGVTEDGQLIIDLRAAREEEQTRTLSELGKVDVLWSREALVCVNVKKGG